MHALGIVRNRSDQVIETYIRRITRAQNSSAPRAGGITPNARELSDCVSRVKMKGEPHEQV